jgi:hypothetical protein
VEQITSQLTERGHDVTVYCRPHVVDRSITTWKGATLVHLPTVRNKYLDTFVHTFLSSVHAARGPRPDVALFFIAGNSPLCLITRGAGIPTVIKVDGLDSDRRKWNRFAKAYLRAAERLSPRMAHRAITDSYAVARIYEQRYGRHIGACRTGRRSRGRWRAAFSTSWGSSRGATSSSSAGSSRRTTRTCSWRRGRGSRRASRRG